MLARRALLLAAAAVAPCPALRAQTLDDGFFLAPGVARATVEYGAERWDRYWEGELLRTNGNIGTLTTRSATVAGGYGLRRGLSVFAALPYVATQASQGVLQGQRGAQDLTVALKYRVARGRVAGRTEVSALALGAAGTPVSDYTPDFLPMSIGLGARRASARAAVHVQDRTGVFADAAVGRTWRGNVRLDRPAYYTDGRLYLTDRVSMPDVADLSLAAGFQNARWCLPLMLTAQRTLGGGDIRRQDMPFVSNRMDFVRLHARAMYTLPQSRFVQLQAGAFHTLSGRNVGLATGVSAGATVQFRPWGAP